MTIDVCLTSVPARCVCYRLSYSDSDRPLTRVSPPVVCVCRLSRSDGRACDDVIAHDVIARRVSEEALAHSFSAPSQVLLKQRQTGSLDAVLYVSVSMQDAGVVLHMPGSR